MTEVGVALDVFGVDVALCKSLVDSVALGGGLGLRRRADVGGIAGHAGRLSLAPPLV